MENEAPLTSDANANAALRSRPHSTIQLQASEESPLLGNNEAPNAGYLGCSDELRSSEINTQKSWRKPHVFWILPFLFIYMLGFGGMVVPKINLVLSLVCRDYFAEKTKGFGLSSPVFLDENNAQCRIPEVQSLVARFQLYLNLVAGILSAVVSPRLGRLSDRYGRTKIIALVALGSALGEAFIVLVASRPESMPIWLLLVGSVFEGLGGSFTTMLALVTSYAADCTLPGKRSVAFGFTHGVLFIGIAAGPALAAILLKKTGHVLLVFCAGLASHIVFLLTIVMIVPESLSKERQRVAREKHQTKILRTGSVGWISWSRWNPMNLITPLSILCPPVGRPSTFFPNHNGASTALRRNIILLSIIDTAVFGVAMGTGEIIIIYSQYMFGWGNVESSYFISMTFFVRVVNLFVILPVVSRIFAKPSRGHAITGSSGLEVFLIRFSVLLDLVGYIGYVLSTNGSAMLASGVIAALGGMGSAILQSSLTKHVPRDRIGQILGAIGLLHALSRVAAPTVFNLIYSVTVGKFTQAVFVCLAAIFGLALFCSIFVRPHVRLDDAFPNGNYAETCREEE